MTNDRDEGSGNDVKSEQLSRNRNKRS